MKIKLKNLLRETPGIKAKAIAKKIELDKSEVNSLLYAHPDVFKIDENYCWTLTSSELRIELDSNCWVSCSMFERTLANAGSPLDSDAHSIIFVIPEGCSLLLETIARLMALCNQLDLHNKKVTIDLTNCTSAFTYLDRVGFFVQLSPTVIVLPQRPTISAASIYKGNSEALVEFGAIDPVHPDDSIPIKLKNCFVSLTESKYALPAFTVLSELFSNVLEHSESPLPGFVALQYYKRGRNPHIQTVISDSGKGIIGTLMPVIANKYPEIANEIFNSSASHEELLLKKVFMNGEISRVMADGRGLGLKRSSVIASEFNGKIIVRQENCEARFFYRDGVLHRYLFENNMSRILGTHICFDFMLDYKA